MQQTFCILNYVVLSVYFYEPLLHAFSPRSCSHAFSFLEIFSDVPFLNFNALSLASNSLASKCWISAARIASSCDAFDRLLFLKRSHFSRATNSVLFA